MLELDDLHSLSISGTPNGTKILKARRTVNESHRELLYYGKFRVMACLPIDLYTKVRKQEDIVRKKYHKALNASKKDVGIVQEFVKSAMSLVKGYELVIKTAKDRGLEKLDVDFFNIEISDGREIFVVPNEDMKDLLRTEKGTDNLCIYSMPELCFMLSDDKIAYELKTNFNATLTGVKCADKTKN